MKDAESRRYGVAFNAIILTEQPFLAPANDLEKAMVALARTPSKESERAFETVLLTSKVYLPTTREGVAKTKADPTQVTFLRLPIETGRPHAMVVFTSPARLRQSLHNETEWPWIALSGRQALATGAGYPIVVNYGLRPPVYIEPEQISRLLAQSPAP